MRIRLGTTPPVALLAAALAGSGVGWSQETQAPRAPELLVPVSTELVRIDVVVTQKGGQPRVGLKQDDFVVLEDGQPQPITQFEWFVSEPSPSAAAAAAATEAADETAPPRPIPPRRYVVLAVDDVHMEAGSLIRIKKALDRFLEREVGPEDQIALVNTAGSRRLYQEFTDDRHALRRSIDRLTVQDRSVIHTGVPYITEYQAELIARGDEDALRVAIEETMQAGLYRDEDNAEKHSRAVARSVHTESLHYGRMTLETLDSVVRSLSELPGRKVIALVSDGFLTGLTANATSAFDIRRIADAGTRAGVVIYAMDTRGLVATTAGMSASSRMPVQSSTFSARDTMVRDGERATREAMNALSMDTGGFLIESANDLNGGLRRILKDTETYYVIAYEPTNTKRDGAFRKLEVRLPNLKDVRIRTRKGYFAPDERRLAATRSRPPVIEEKPDPLEPPPGEDELKAALTSVAPLHGIPVRLSADFVSLDDSSPQIVVSSSVDLGGIPFVMDQERRVAIVAAGAMVFDESGAPVGTLEPQRVAMNLTDEAFARAVKSGLLYQKAAPVKPGRYRVRFVARDEASGKSGSASAWVEIPALEAGELSLSSLFLLKRDDRGASTSPPATPEQGPNLREVQAQRRYRKGEDLFVQLFAYNPKRDETGTTSLIAQAEVWKSGALLASSAPESLAAEGGSARIAHLRSIKLKPFEPGNYEVRMVITDQNAKRMASRRAGFTIVE